MFEAKDFIETAEGLLFAVVTPGLERGKIRCFLRYRLEQGIWRKLDTDQANCLLSQHYPGYRYHSSVTDSALHAVEEGKVIRHYQPQPRLQQWLQAAADDAVIGDLQSLCRLLAGAGLDLTHWGVTGSVLVGRQNAESDIDLVCYDRNSFHAARHAVASLVADGRLQALSDTDWLSAYRRRACDFSLGEYIWHEARKFNKALINGRKFDLSLVLADASQQSTMFRKQGAIRLQATVTDDQFAFDYPARLLIDHSHITEVVCFTATYAGQAKTGETIVAAGQMEVDESGTQRLVVGSSRESPGEFIRVQR